jgi:hypothetical protein
VGFQPTKSLRVTYRHIQSALMSNLRSSTNWETRLRKFLAAKPNPRDCSWLWCGEILPLCVCDAVREQRRLMTQANQRGTWCSHENTRRFMGTESLSNQLPINLRRIFCYSGLYLQRIRHCRKTVAYLSVLKQSYLCNRLCRHVVLWDTEDLALSRQSALRWR